QVLFERVLKTAPVSVDASFFELGGDSLQALELLVEIEKATGKCTWSTALGIQLRLVCLENCRSADRCWPVDIIEGRI
ncbi:MAG TPA: acyl carrier protein, partial [Candidatus Kapabacteria bacterium]|nr:acyl carrier protein [Candidatus Kapabacteria bacterium]